MRHSHSRSASPTRLPPRRTGGDPRSSSWPSASFSLGQSVEGGLATQGHINFVQNVTLMGQGTVNVAMTPSNAAKLNGTWRDTASGTSMTVNVDTIAQNATIVIDFRGSQDPPAETFSGPYSTTTGANLTRTSPVLGTISVNVTPTGAISGNLTNVPDPDITRVDFEGTATTTSFTMTSTFRYADGDVDVVRGTLTK